VVILGAGIAGLCTAFELEKAGYQCTIIEASHRPGGRNLTLRHGDLIDELGNRNYCKFDDSPNLFFNAGPARIPGHHKRLLGYCKQFKIPLHVRANVSKLAYSYDGDAMEGKPVRIGQYLTDARGYIAELMQKGISQKAFDQQLSKKDLEKLSDFMGLFGDLNKSGFYLGTERAGAKNDRLMETPDTPTPFQLSEILKNKTWKNLNWMSELYDWQAPLMEPIGGMDKIVDGFVGAIRAPIILNAQVQSVFQSSNDVSVTYQKDGRLHTVSADFCFNNIPSHFMSGIQNNLSNDLSQALAALKRGHLFKIAFQMRERFWESEGIYGGISYTTDDIAQIWYPSHDIHADKGIVLGAYSWELEHNLRFEAMTPEERLAEAAKCGAKIHKAYQSYIEVGASVMWSRMNHMMGCGAHLSHEVQKSFLPVLQKPEGRHFMIGDQVSIHSGWQESALASVENALRHFNDMRAEQA